MVLVEVGRDTCGVCLGASGSLSERVLVPKWGACLVALRSMANHKGRKGEKEWCEVARDRPRRVIGCAAVAGGACNKRVDARLRE